MSINLGMSSLLPRLASALAYLRPVTRSTMLLHRICGLQYWLMLGFVIQVKPVRRTDWKCSQYLWLQRHSFGSPGHFNMQQGLGYLFGMQQMSGDYLALAQV